MSDKTPDEDVADVVARQRAVELAIAAWPQLADVVARQRAVELAIAAWPQLSTDEMDGGGKYSPDFYVGFDAGVRYVRSALMRAIELEKRS